MKRILSIISLSLIIFGVKAQGDPAVSFAGFTAPSVGVNGSTILNIDVTNNDFVNFNTIPSGGYQVTISLPATLQYTSQPLDASAMTWVSGPLFSNITFDGTNVFTADLAAPQNVGDVSRLQIVIKGLVITSAPVTTVVAVAPLLGGVAGTDNPNNNTLLPSLSVSAVLPIKLISFAGNERDCNSQLNWQSNNEVNFNRFEIEYSSDGRNYNVVGTVKGQSTGTISSYQFSYAQTVATGYYRLKMVDNDGVVNYSNTIKITNTCNQPKASLYPNPVTAQIGGNVVLQNFGTKIAGNLYDANGKLLQVIRLTNGTNKINLLNYASGNYMLKVYDENSNSALLRIIIAR